MSKVSSSPTLEQDRSPLQTQKSLAPTISNEASSISEQVASGSISQGDMNLRKRKAGAKGKAMEDATNCSKVTGKALMLDEIINYVQSLQREVEFLSMKLASVNPSLDFDNGNRMSMDICHPVDSPSSS